jgi:hypothetical protein
MVAKDALIIRIGDLPAYAANVVGPSALRTYAGVFTPGRWIRAEPAAIRQERHLTSAEALTR